MKKTFYSIFAAAMIFATVSCSSDDDNSTTSPAQVTATVTSGTWKITQFNDSGTDETAHFTGYNFTFATSGALTAANGTNSYTGVWSVESDDSGDDDSSSNDVDFNIAFVSSDNFTELTEDWHILERTSTKLRLQHISGGNGGTDLLTFQKN
ncbi:hypothetical protein [Flavobacterium sp. 3HN19-14]|uniref:hypothetical protein n=1 Tax=Flavobacterium sp. 3HN19-14 TaxID=3448133 RepID=UPI003EE3CEF0